MVEQLPPNLVIAPLLRQLSQPTSVFAVDCGVVFSVHGAPRPRRADSNTRIADDVSEPAFAGT
jgi:hypothetical protein